MRRGRAEDGFTLVEVVVALLLVSLVMLGLTTALHTFGETGARLDVHRHDAEDMRLVSAFLRQSFADASARRLPLGPDGGLRPGFVGTPDVVEWLAPMPARQGVGGLHRLRLSVSELRTSAGEDRRLVLQFVPFVVAERDIDWTAEPEHVLVPGLAAFSIRYLGSEGSWKETWAVPGLPRGVRLRIANAAGPWPELVAGVRAARVAPGEDGADDTSGIGEDD